MQPRWSRFLATMFFGGLLFAILGKNPVEAIGTIFWEPLFGEFSFYYRPQLLVKGAPLVLIAIGLSLGFRAGIWNIGAEGQYIMGAIFRRRAPVWHSTRLRHGTYSRSWSSPVPSVAGCGQ